MKNMVLFTTDNEGLDELFQDFLHEEEISEDDISFYEWKEDYIDDSWNDFIGTLSCNEVNYEKCVIVGNLGLWDGNKPIIPIICSSLTEAIKRCTMNVNEIEITLNDGFINVSAIHHDGVNNFDIHLLNKKGCQCVNGNFNNPTYYKKIKSL